MVYEVKEEVVDDLFSDDDRVEIGVDVIDGSICLLLRVPDKRDDVKNAAFAETDVREEEADGDRDVVTLTFAVGIAAGQKDHTLLLSSQYMSRTYLRKPLANRLVRQVPNASSSNSR